MKYDEIFDYSEYSVAANYRDYVSDPNSFLPYCTWPGVKLYKGIANYDFAVLVKDHDCFFPVIIYEEGLFMTGDEKSFTISDLVNGVFSSYSVKTYSSKEF